MNFKQANQYLESLINYEKKSPKKQFDFERFLDNLKEFGSPHLELKNPVLIAGTKGKGSTAHHIVSGFLSKGFKNVGLFTSPHIINVRERIRIDNKNIEESEFIKYVLKIKEKIEKGMSLTYFESLTIMGFLYFRDKRTNFNVLEIGLGGRLDAVNSCPSDFSIITPISYDHEHILGNSLSEIAWEKSFVIKGKNAIIAPQPREVMDVLIERAKSVGADMYLLCKNIPLKILETSQNGTYFKIYFENKWNYVETPQIGDFQAINSALAWIYLKLNGVEVSKFNPLKIEGRLEVIKKEPLFIVDGAHNPLSIRAVVRNVRKIFKKNPDIIIFGTNRDKRFEKMLMILKEFEPEILILTQSRVKRRIDPGILYNFSKKISFKKVYKFYDAEEGIKFAFDNTHSHSFILLTGSFYLVEIAKKFR